MRLGWRTTRVDSLKLAILRRNWEYAKSTQENYCFLLYGCYMYNYWGTEQIRAWVSRYDQSAWTANQCLSSKWSTYCKHRFAAVLAHTQGQNEWSKGAQFPGRRKVPKMSQVLSPIQKICFRKISGSNMRAPNLLLSSGAIWPCYTPAYTQCCHIKKLKGKLAIHQKASNSSKLK